MANEAEASAVRRAFLLKNTRERGFLRVTDAAALLGVSGVTVRADLTSLEGEGLVQRVHGGAMPVASQAEPESSLERSLSRDATSKLAIGSAAASIVESGQSIILDVGSTALAVAEALVRRSDLRDLVVITNGLAIALALEEAIPRFTVVVSGGTLRPLQHSLVSPFASEYFARFNADIAFIGCNGVHVARGVTNVNLPEAEVKRAMLRAAARGVAIAEGAKLGQHALGVIAPISDFDVLVTAGTAPQGELALLRAAGLTVLVGEESLKSPR